MKSTNKYNAKKSGGFASTKEERRFYELKAMEAKGEIVGLKCQVVYELIPSQYVDGRCKERSCKYIADFVYNDAFTGKQIVEDVKGYRGGQAYAIYKIKRKLMLHEYGIEVHEV